MHQHSLDWKMFNSFRNILVQYMVIFWPKTDNGHIDDDITKMLKNFAIIFYPLHYCLIM